MKYSNNSAKSNIFNPLVIGQWPRLVRMMKKTGGRKNLVGLSLITSFLSRLRFFPATFSLVAFNRFQNWFYPPPLPTLTPLPYPQLTRGKGVQTILYSLVRGGIFSHHTMGFTKLNPIRRCQKIFDTATNPASDKRHNWRQTS